MLYITEYCIHKAFSTGLKRGVCTSIYFFLKFRHVWEESHLLHMDTYLFFAFLQMLYEYIVFELSTFLSTR